MLFISVAIVIGLFTLKTAVPQLKIEKNQAEVLATQELEKRGFKLIGQWKTISDVSSKIMTGTSLTEVVITPSDIIKREGSGKYKSLIENYIIPLKWHVRFIKIDGDVNSIAEEYNVTLTDKGQEINLEHRIPDNRKGVNLTKEDTKSVLYKVIKEKYALTESDLKEISADEKKLDGRTDWSFVLEDKTVHLKEYIPQIKATISGDEVLSPNKTLDLPESKRNDMFKNIMILTIIMFVALIPFIGSILVAAVRSIIAWTKEQISKTISIRLFIFLLILNGLSLFLDAPSSMITYSTAMPFKISLITTYALGILGKLLMSFFQASIIAYAKSFYGQATQRKYFGIALSVIAAMFIFTLGLVFASRSLLISDSFIYCSLGYYNKLLSELVHVCSSYIGSLATIFALTAILNNTKKKFWKVFLTISILLPLGEYVSIGVSSPLMVIIFLSTGIVYIVLYLYLFKQDCSLIPLFIGTLALLDIIKGLLLTNTLD